jgi:hypothetical protein
MSDLEKSDATPSAPKVVDADAAGLTIVAAAASVEAAVRRNFSGKHLKAAAHFAEELHHHEGKHAGAGWGSHFDFCSWNASAAIILGFSAIEAAVDEAEDDLALPRELTDALDRVPTLEHVQALLAHCGSATFEKGAEPYQSAHLLRDLRNGLVHPKAEWDSARDRNKKLSKKILGAGLELSPFQPDPDFAFPHGCMSAGVARWAESSARLFIRELRSRLGLNPTE